MSIKFLVLGGGGILGFLGGGGGGECRFYFYGREDFSDIYPVPIFERESSFLIRNGE